MRRLIITESNSLWVAETSAGVRWQAGSLESLLNKLAPVGFPTYDATQLLDEVFEKIPPVNASNIASGLAGA